MHGANRLGADSLLDIVIFGRSAALTTKSEFKPGTPQPELPSHIGEESIGKLEKIRTANGAYPTAYIRERMQETMQLHAAAFREAKSLQDECKKLEDVCKLFKDVKTTDRGLVFNTM